MNQVRDRFSVGTGFDAGKNGLKDLELRDLDLKNQLGSLDRATFSGMSTAARASMVNRTHRIVRERAGKLNERRSLARSLWFPMLVCSAMLVILCWTVWTVFAEFEVVPSGMPESGDQSFVLLLWFLPISATLLAAVWIRRTRGGVGEETSR